ncbi:hypothetical protein N9V68_00340 [Octadecabacter sp.]|nr:hypothetical protein [Octadecabacter sp.]
MREQTAPFGGYSPEEETLMSAPKDPAEKPKKHTGGMIGVIGAVLIIVVLVILVAS